MVFRTDPFYDDLIDRQQHVLIAGMTGSGKSVIINGMINSLLIKSDSKHVMVLIDPKRVELSQYKHVPHCIVFRTEIDEIEKALEACLRLIDDRFREMEIRREKFYSGTKMHVFIDELADLMLNSKKAATSIQRIAQIGRAANVQLICATQTPISEVIPTKIKVNFGIVIGLHTRSKQDSRNIIGVIGCESLPLYGKAKIIYPGEDIKDVSVPMIPEESIDELVSYRVNEQAETIIRHMEEKEEAKNRKIKARESLVFELEKEESYFRNNVLLYAELDELRSHKLPKAKKNASQAKALEKESIRSALVLAGVTVGIVSWFIVESIRLFASSLISFLLCMGICVGLGLIIRNVVSNRIRQKSALASNELNDLYDRFIQIENDLASFYADYDDCILPIEYTNPSIIKCIKLCIKHEFADSLSESIELLNNASHIKKVDIEKAKIDENMELNNIGKTSPDVFFCPSWYYSMQRVKDSIMTRQ